MADELTDGRSGARSAQVAVWLITAATFAAHLAVAGRYDIFRNELYFIACGHRPDWGYADLPPLVALLGAGLNALAGQVWVLRLPAVFAAAGLVPLTAAYARLLGAGRGGAVLAALAAAMAPALVALTTILTTETFEPITWTACAYFLTRAIVRERPINLLWAALVAGVAMEVKYGMAIWLIALAIGILLTQTRLYAKRHLWLAVAVVAILSAPSLIWQAMHDWAFIAVTIEHKKGNFTGTPLSFAIGQAFAINIALAPLWIAGLIAPFVGSRLKEARPVAIAFVAAAVLIFVTHGKDYYLFPAYPALFAIGAAAAGALPTWLRTVWISLAIANSALLAPIVLPILDPPALAAYMARAHLSPLPDEAAAVGAPLTQVFSDEMGWRELEQQVAKVYRALPPEDRTHAAIIASNYGEAAAIDVYGRVDGLPPALSGQNQYFLWGPRGFDGSVIIHINGDMDRWRYACESVELAGTFGVPYAMPYERDRPIFICRNLHGGLAAAWAKFKRYR